ncbi:MAG: sugar ABC transporter permease [Lachnospiraceae bacterium]|nr:sugar ABC transporter permease [Lachnospiraceae bacterium]
MRKDNAQPLERRKMVTGLCLAAPVLLGTFLFFLLPFAICVKYSFTFGVGGASFAGFQNYKEVFSSRAFRLAAANTLRFLAIGVTANLALSFFLAVLIQKGLKGSRFFRYILLLPLVLPIASVVMVIQVFFAETGVLNHWLIRLGVPVVQWLEGPEAFWVLLGLYLWKSVGYGVILLLSGLNAIPGEFYQTAAMEGAGGLRKLVSITLPLMAPHFFLAAVMGIVNAFKSYREAFLLGGKHPHDSIYMMQHFLNNNFENLNYQKLSVAAILLLLALLALLWVLYLFQNRYRGE